MVEDRRHKLSVLYFLEKNSSPRNIGSTGMCIFGNLVLNHRRSILRNNTEWYGCENHHSSSQNGFPPFEMISKPISREPTFRFIPIGVSVSSYNPSRFALYVHTMQRQ
mmetsp:Transcript_32188/g.78474  ORF Transcript_32188/g.78474 Transcript_32188/m.78474 type:complete len:108 (+) Transcript_32188:1175-1498(+)